MGEASEEPGEVAFESDGVFEVVDILVVGMVLVVEEVLGFSGVHPVGVEPFFGLGCDTKGGLGEHAKPHGGEDFGDEFALKHLAGFPASNEKDFVQGLGCYCVGKGGADIAGVDEFDALVEGHFE